MALSVTDKYTDIATADVYLVLNDKWLQLDDETKDNALVEARYFLNENFDLSGITDVSNLALIPNELQYASSLLAADAINSDLFLRHYSKLVKEQSVKAGSVASAKKFVTSNSHLLPKSFSKVKVILSSLYSQINNINFLVRA